MAAVAAHAAPWLASDFAMPMPRDTARDALLQDIWDRCNALGGIARSEHERGITETVDKVLAIIEAKQAEVRHGA